MKQNYLILIVVAAVAFSLGTLYTPNNSESTVREKADTWTGSANIVAAAENSNTGAIGEVKVEVVPGNGNVLVETDPFIQANTQLSATKAKQVAE